MNAIASIKPGCQRGRLTVLRLSRRGYTPIALCRCSCGTLKEIVAYSLVSGNTKSCGCLHRELLSKRKRTHGMTGSKLHWIWKGMVQRCYNQKHISYKNYGAVGITVCLRWRKSFIDFYKDVGQRPSSKHSLERIDNKKGYTPSNVSWATWTEQARNRKTNLHITYKGKTRILSEWARIYRMNETTLCIRLKRWNVAEAFEVPKNAKVKYWRKRRKALAC